MRSLAAITICLALVAVPAQALPSPSLSPIPGLAEFAWESHNRTDVAFRSGMVANALAFQAYPSAVVLSGEALASQWDAMAWESSQAYAKPRDVYLSNATHMLELAGAAIVATAAQLRGVLDLGIVGTQTGVLLEASRLLAEADVNFGTAQESLAILFSGSNAISRVERFSLARSLSLALQESEAASELLDGLAPSEGKMLDLIPVVVALEELEDLPSGRAARDVGLLYDLSRAVLTWEGRFRPAPNETMDDLERAIGEARVHQARLRDAGIGTERLDAVLHDASFWLKEARVNYTEPAWVPLLSTVYGQVKGAQLEAEILTNHSEQKSLGLGWKLAGVGAVAGAAGLIAAVWRRRGRGQSLLGIMALTVLLAVPAIPMADAEPLPANPDNVPVAMTGASGIAGLGDVAILGDGRLQFVWSEQLGSGLYVIKGRTFDPAARSWSTPAQVVQSSENANSPRLVEAGQTLHLFWLQGYGSTPETERVTLWWCIFQGATCSGQPTRLTDTTKRVLQFSADGEADGTVWLAYADLQKLISGSESFGTMFVREYAGGWQAAVPMADGGASQTQPAIAADPAGGAHVVWQQPPSNGVRINTATHYAFVPSGALVAPGNEKLSSRSPSGGASAVIVEDGVLTVLFDQPTGPDLRLANLYEMHRPVEGGDWSVPSNVSRSARSPLWPSLRVVDGNLLALWAEADPVDNFILQMSLFREGVWTRPIRLSPTGYSTLVPFFEVDADKRMNIVWSGPGPGVTETQQHFRRIAIPSPSSPPSITGTDPSRGEWSTNNPLPVSVHFVADWPLDADATTLTIDGTAQFFQVLPDHLLAYASGLQDGTHQAKVVLNDGHGGTATAEWEFRVDRTAPEFTWSIATTAGEPAPAGWSKVPLVMTGAIDPDQGAPGHLELQSGEGPWLLFPGSWPLVEGAFASFRMRAVDEAGNVRLSERIEAGYDASPPEVEYGSPGPWATNGTVQVLFKVNETLGSPVLINARLIDAASNLTSATLTVPGHLGRVELSGAPEGAYVVELVASDEAGNQAEPVAWPISFDGTKPSLTVEPQRNGTLRIMAGDAGSGMAAIEVRRGSALPIVVLAHGEASTETYLGVLEGAIIVARDVGGNQAVVKAPKPLADVPDDGTEIGLDGADHQEPWKGVPTLGVVPILLGPIALALLSRRWAGR